MKKYFLLFLYEKEENPLLKRSTKSQRNVNFNNKLILLTRIFAQIVLLYFEFYFKKAQGRDSIRDKRKLLAWINPSDFFVAGRPLAEFENPSDEGGHNLLSSASALCWNLFRFSVWLNFRLPDAVKQIRIRVVGPGTEDALTGRIYCALTVKGKYN